MALRTLVPAEPVGTADPAGVRPPPAEAAPAPRRSAPPRSRGGRWRPLLRYALLGLATDLLVRVLEHRFLSWRRGFEGIAG
ncbi:hypothetical protein ACFFWC_20835 [Plantactinospora siamensis]|uniref:Uncharacterized protein n=1 Tax=Plantactinospora siamensis TaxID=555372 RepID=A0ABV6NS36_9ACTN